jgi:hypothetical protein
MKTKFLISILLAFIGLSVCAQSKIDTLTNEKIIQLSKIGLQPSIIINKIQTSLTRFEVGTDALIFLSDNQVPSDVINEMIRVTTQQQIEVSNKVDLTNPNEMHSPGIYYYNAKDNSSPVKKVDPTVMGNTRTGGGSFYGFGGTKTTSSISGSLSRLQISEAKPVFYFYFERNNNPYADNWWFATATSPNEFVLVKLDQTKESRIIEIGSSTSIGGFGGGNGSGIPEKTKIQFSYDQVSDGIYRVSFQQDLKPGEYCFVYASDTPSRFSNNKVFDFGIPKTQ